METLLVRLKAFDPRRGHVLRRFTYSGIKFQPERGWYRVEKQVAEYLRGVHQQPSDAYTPLAFDVCTDAEAKALDAAEAEETQVKKAASDDIKVVQARPTGAVTTEDLPKATSATAHTDDNAQRHRRGRD
jgi:hypothetical protein